MPRAKAKIKDASRELKYPLGYIHPTGYVCAAVCFKDERGFWHSGYKYEHRLVVEWWHDRKLRPGEYVRFRDGDRTNNRLENLKIVTKQEHFSLMHEARKRQAREKKREKVLGTIA